jgi:hypothetical protein
MIEPQTVSVSVDDVRACFRLHVERTIMANGAVGADKRPKVGIPAKRRAELMSAPPAITEGVPSVQGLLHVTRVTVFAAKDLESKERSRKP